MRQEKDEATANRRRAEAVRELYEFRMRLGLDDGIAELMVYAAATGSRADRLDA